MKSSGTYYLEIPISKNRLTLFKCIDVGLHFRLSPKKWKNLKNSQKYTFFYCSFWFESWKMIDFIIIMWNRIQVDTDLQKCKFSHSPKIPWFFGIYYWTNFEVWDKKILELDLNDFFRPLWSRNITGSREQIFETICYPILELQLSKIDISKKLDMSIGMKFNLIAYRFSVKNLEGINEQYLEHSM